MSSAEPVGALRPATGADVPRLRDVERAAGRSFAVIGMDAVADDEPPSPAVLLSHVEAGTAWVHTAGGEEVGAYVLASVVDGNGHVDQVSVHPEHAGRGLGHALVEHVACWARARRLPALTLTTFRDVPWNGPYYARRGFRWLADDEITPGLRELRAVEAAHGLDAWPRGCMRRDL